MKNLNHILIAIFCFSCLNLKAQLYVANGAVMHLSDSAVVTLNNTNLTSNTAITGIGKGRIVIKGDSITTINNNGNKIFGLEIDNAANVLMNHNLEIDGIFKQTNGALQVNGKILTLSGIAEGSTGTITGNVLSELIITGTGSLGNLYFTPNNNLFKNVTFNRSGSANIANTLRVASLLNIANGTLNSDGNIILQSDSLGTARVAQITSGTVSGNVVTERYIAGGNSISVGATPGSRAFRFLSHPFSSFSNLTQLTNRIDVTGSGATASPTGALFTQTVTNAPSAFWYNSLTSNASATNDAGWTPFTNSLPTQATDNNAWKVGQGLRVLVRGAKGEGLSGGNYQVSNVTLSMNGPLNILTTPLNYNLQTNGTGLGYGWNLVGNPLASPIEVKAKIKALRESNTGGANSNINATGYVWNPNASNTNNGGWQVIDFTALGSYKLPMHGVILVQTVTNNNTALSIGELDKTDTTNAVDLFRTNNLTNTLSLSLQDDNNSLLDETFVRINNKASYNFDSYDGGKLINQYAIFTQSKDNANTYLQSIPPPSNNDSINVGVRAAVPKAYTLAVNDYNPPAGMHFYLKDKYLLKESLLTPNFLYPFSVTNNAATQGDNRFQIVMKNATVLPIAGLNLTAVQLGANAIKVNYTALSEVNMRTYDVEESENGLQFTKAFTQAALVNNNTDAKYTWIDNIVNKGNNYYRIKSTASDGKVLYSNTVNVKLNGEKNLITVYPNPVMNKLVNLQLHNAEKGNYKIAVYDEAGKQIVTTTYNHIGGSSTKQIQLPLGTTQGMYEISIETTNGEKKVIKVVVE